MGMGQSPRLKAEDVDAIRERVPDAQFLVEAILLSLIGGLLGVGLRVSLSEGLTQFLAWPTSVPADAVVVAVGLRRSHWHLLRLLSRAQGGPVWIQSDHYASSRCGQSNRLPLRRVYLHNDLVPSGGR